MKDNGQATAEDLLALFHRILESTETFFILGALDECNNREGVLTYVEETKGWKTGKLHLLVTSRRARDIEEGLHTLLENQNKICRIESALVNDDIRSYIHERLQSCRRLKRWHK